MGNNKSKTRNENKFKQISEPDSSKDRTVLLFDTINFETISKALASILVHWREDSKKEIELIICSMGGFCNASFMFIDMIDRHGINLTTIASGGVGSMAVPIFAAGRKRLVTEHTELFLHDLGNYPGKGERRTATDLQRESDNLEVSRRWYAEYIEKRTLREFKASKVLKFMKEEKYLYPKDLLRFGLASEII